MALRTRGKCRSGRHYVVIFVVLVLALHIHDCGCMLITKQIDRETKQAGQEGILNCTIAKDATISGQRYSWQRLPLEPYPYRVIAINSDVVTRNPRGDDGRTKYHVSLTTVKESYIYSLHVRRLGEEDHGEYKCIVMVAGWATDSYPSTTGELVVQLPPGVDDIGSSTMVQVLEGNNATIRCTVSGVPFPTVTWTRANGKALPGGAPSSGGEQLDLAYVGGEDAGVYRCTAENGVRPPEWRDIPLVVYHSPNIKPFRKTVGQAPDKNYDVEIACIASGDPQPDLMWWKGQQRITDDFKHEIHKIDVMPGHGLRHGSVWYTLRIMNIQTNDYGNYTCQAKNIYGESSSGVYLFYTPTCQGYSCHRENVIAAGQTTGLSEKLLPICLIIMWMLA